MPRPAWTEANTRASALFRLGCMCVHSGKGVAPSKKTRVLGHRFQMTVSM